MAAKADSDKQKIVELKKENKNLRQKVADEAKNIRKEFAKRTLTLLTSGFGLVSALAWNEVIREFVNVYVKPFFGEESGLISLAIYAFSITALAVVVTYNLSKIAGKDEK